MSCGIYKITSTSKKIYIGQSRNIEKRFLAYRYRECTNQRKLNNSFKKYGIDTHAFEIIEICTVEELNIRERYWQDFYNTINNGLNCLFTKTDEKPLIFSDETKKRMSQSQKGEKNYWFGKKREQHPKFGILGCNNAKSKKVRDNISGIIYDCAREAAEATKIKYGTLISMLCGIRKNKTTLEYI